MRIVKLFFVFVSIVLLSNLVQFVHAAQTNSGEAYITPSADTYVDASHPLSNYGGGNYLDISSSGTSIQMVWLKYDFKAHTSVLIPEGAVIDNATLMITPVILTETFQISVFSCSNSSWDEYTLNFINQPERSKSPIANLIVPTVSKKYNLDITNYIKNTFATLSSSNSQITLVLEQNQAQIGYTLLEMRSRENFSTASLYIHWNDSVPEFSSWLILPLFIIITLLISMIYLKKHKERK